MRPALWDDPHVHIAGPNTIEVMQAALGDSSPPDASGQYMAQCPAPGHPDAVKSLRWRATADGRILLHCFTGNCEYKDILSGLRLEHWQLQPVSVEYDYIDARGEYRFTVRRSYGVDGKKEFRQGVRGDKNEWIPTVEGVDTALLFRADVMAAAERGPVRRVLICEGEKDAVVLDAALAAEGVPGEYATTFSGGAGRDLSERAAQAVADIGAGAVAIVVDRDASGAGQKRGRALSRWIGEALPDVAIEVLIPIEGTGKDIAEIIDRFGPEGWRERLEAYSFDPVSDALADYGAGIAAGMMVPVSLDVGRPVMAMVKPGKEGVPLAVLTGVIEPEAVHTSESAGRKYAVTVVPSMHVAEQVTAEISSGDLASGQALLKWLSRVPDFGRAPLCGVGAGDIADGLRMYLDYRVHVAGKPVMVSPEACGWVDAVTGVNADRAPVGAGLVFVDRDGRVVAAAGVESVKSAFAAPEVRHGGSYGFVGTETDAAWAMWQALTFAPAEVTAPVAGFVGATLLSPFFAAAGAGLRPGLAAVAPSGSGKTHGAVGLILELAGCGGHQSGSAAGMRRKLEAGVGTMLWFDDTAAVEESRMKEWMRVAITRSEFTLSDTDAGVTGVHGGGLTSVPVVSSEGVGWLAETAMRDRFIVVHPTNPQGRMSWWKGRETESQWVDFGAVETGLLAGKPQSVSGWVVAGVVEALGALGSGSPWEGAKVALGAARGGFRREWAASVEAAGLAAVVGWLEKVRREAGEAWPGIGAGEWAESLSWLEEGQAWWRGAVADPTSAAACSLVDEVIPRLLQAHHDSPRTAGGHSQYAILGVSTVDRETANRTVRAAISMGSGDTGVERGLPPILVDQERRVWVRTAACASEYGRLVRGAEERTTGASALAGQVGGVADDPAWASFIKGGRVYSGLRIRFDSGEAVYRRLSETASARSKA